MASPPSTSELPKHDPETRSHPVGKKGMHCGGHILPGGTGWTHTPPRPDPPAARLRKASKDTSSTSPSPPRGQVM